MVFELVVVGASLGGLAALEKVLAGLPDGFEVPIAVAQHRRPDAESRLAALLSSKTGREVREPDDKEPIERGVVYVAPADYHLLVEPGAFALSVDGPVTFARPSIDVLFETAAEAYGPRLAAVLLTASSEDGAAGIAAVAARGGATVVEDPATAASPIAGRAAMARTEVDHVLPVRDIGPLLGGLAERSAGSAPVKRKATS